MANVEIRLAESPTLPQVIAPPPPEPPAPEPRTSPALPVDSVWRALSLCESAGNWQSDDGDGYYGGLQFDLPSWQAVGGEGYPSEHPQEVQIEMAERLQARQGWAAWPNCSRMLGLF
ncbi:MAG: transglycosylase family protein [Acidimicrobiales bacterium]